MALEQTAAAESPAARPWLWAVLLYCLIRVALIPITTAAVNSAPPPPLKEQLPAGSALQRTLVAPWHRWDVIYYAQIAAGEYGRGVTTNFHPAYPWLARLPGLLSGGNWTLGLLLVSGAATIALYVLAERLARRDQAPALARWSAITLALLPSAFIFYAPYSESLFLVCAVLCFLYARSGRWWLAGLAGWAATMTRQQGIVLALPMLWEMAEAAGGWRALLRSWRRGSYGWLACALPPLGLVTIILYRALALNDLPEGWWLPQNWIYTLLISPAAQEMIPGQRFVAPWTAIWLALEDVWAAPLIGRLVDLGTAALYLLLLAAGWRRLRPSYRVYAAAIYVLALCYHTGPVWGYQALPRHMLLAFPVAFPLAEWTAAAPRRLLLGLLGGMLLGFEAFLYVAHVWVP